MWSAPCAIADKREPGGNGGVVSYARGASVGAAGEIGAGGGAAAEIGAGTAVAVAIAPLDAGAGAEFKQAASARRKAASAAIRGMDEGMARGF